MSFISDTSYYKTDSGARRQTIQKFFINDAPLFGGTIRRLREDAMRKYSLFVLICLLVLVAACSGQQAQKAAQGEAEYRTTATIKDIMDSMVDPGSDVIWDSVETIVSAKGTEEKMPRTDEEWKNVRRHAIMLLEATNLLLIPGRKVAQAGEKADDPKVELAPEQIQTLIDQDRAAFTKFAHGL